MNITGLSNWFGSNKPKELYFQPGNVVDNENIIAKFDKTDGVKRHAHTKELEDVSHPTAWTRFERVIGPHVIAQIALGGIGLSLVKAGIAGAIKGMNDHILFDRDSAISRGLFCTGYVQNNELTLLDNMVSGVSKIKSVAGFLEGHMPTILTTTMNKATQCALSPSLAAATVWLQRSVESISESGLPGVSSANYTMAYTALVAGTLCYVMYKYRESANNQEQLVQAAGSKDIKILTDIRDDLHGKNSRYYWYTDSKRYQVWVLAEDVKKNLTNAMSHGYDAMFSKKQNNEFDDAQQHITNICTTIMKNAKPAKPPADPKQTWMEWLQDKSVDVLLGTVDGVGRTIDSALKYVVR